MNKSQEKSGQVAEIRTESKVPRAVLGGKYLTFRLGNEEYGIPILKVREINGLLDITPIPRMPPAVRGVINLRGKVIPIVDLRRKFGLEQVPDTNRTCIIVVEASTVAQMSLVGILVDTVSEVVNIAEGEIDRALAFGAKVDVAFILGAAKVKGGVKVLLDVDQLITSEELTTFE